MSYNTDYRKELPEGATPHFVDGKTCPKCDKRLVVLPPDRVWCEDENCDTGFMLLIGKGTDELKTYTDENI